VGELGGQVRVSNLVDVPNALSGVSGITHFPIWVTSSQEPLDAFLATIIKTFASHDQQPSDPIERIALRPRCPSVSFWTRRRTRSSQRFANRTTWKVGHLIGVGQHTVIGHLIGT